MDIIIEKQAPARIVRLSSDTWFADFGKAAYGRLEYEIETETPGCQVEFFIGEVLNADGRIERNPGGYRCAKEASLTLDAAGKSRGFMFIKKHRSPYQDTYQRSKVLTPENAGGEVAPFRYAEIRGNLKSLALTRHALFAPFDDDAARFESSDENLNQVWELCKYTMKATSAFGLYIDGERERQCFEGDTYINALGAYCTGGGYEVARRTLDFMISFYPISAVEYRLLTPILVRDYFLYSGDTGIYPYWKRELPSRLLPEFVDSDGLIKHPRTIPFNVPSMATCGFDYQYLHMFPDDMQLLVDWPLPERDNYEYGPCNFVANAFLFAAYQAMHELEPNAGYDTRAAGLLAKIRRLFRTQDGAWLDNSQGTHTALHTAIFALAFNIAEKSDAPALLEFIRGKGMACSVYAAQFLLDACFQAGAEQYAIDLMRSEKKRSWMNMIHRGSTISMEAWDDEFKPNQDWNHAWGAAPANVIPRRLAGIRPISNGFRRFVIDPKPGDIREFTLTHPTPHGSISLEYSQGKVQFTVPEGTQACFHNQILPPGTHQGCLM